MTHVQHIPLYLGYIVLYDGVGYYFRSSGDGRLKDDVSGFPFPVETPATTVKRRSIDATQRIHERRSERQAREAFLKASRQAKKTERAAPLAKPVVFVAPRPAPAYTRVF